MVREPQRYQRRDYSGLLRELNIQQARREDNGINGDSVPAKATRMRTARERVLQMKYVYSEKDKLFHEYECADVKKINDQDLRGSEEFPEQRDPCPVCLREKLLKDIVSAEGSKMFGLCFALMDKFGAKNKDLKMLRVHQAQLYRVEPNAVYLKVGEDKWFVRESQGRLQLFHNNYARTNSVRTIDAGFHLQMEGVNFANIARYVCSYSWGKHLAAEQGPTTNVIPCVMRAAENENHA